MQKLKFEDDVWIGDTIRAYDFEPLPGRVECYVEGIVQRTSSEYGAKCFVINCSKDSLANDPYTGGRVGKEVFVPMETSLDYNARIKVLG